jgi:hypothetical protein
MTETGVQHGDAGIGAIDPQDIVGETEEMLRYGHV